MYRIRMIQPALLAAAMFSSLLLSCPAYACSDLPGICAQQQQQQQETNDYFATPVQSEDEENYAQERRMPSVPRASSYLAVASNYNTSEVWAVTGYRTSDDARKAALGACTAAMGEGCFIGESGWNSSIAVAHDSTGIPWFGWGLASDIAKRDSLKECAKHADGCTVHDVFSAAPLPIPDNAHIDMMDFSQSYFPRGPIKRHTFALVVWPEKDTAPQFGSLVWVASGARDWREMRNEANAACQKTTGIQCKLGKVVANGYLFQMTDENGRSWWNGSDSAANINGNAKKICPDGEACFVVQSFDTNSPRMTMVDQNKPVNPIRGFFALARPIFNAPSWQKMAVVTGQSSYAIAKEQAIVLCQKESHVKCESFLDEDDNGFYPFVGLYSDNAKDTRWFFENSESRIRSRAEASCKKANVKCVLRKMIDLSQKQAAVFSMID